MRGTTAAAGTAIAAAICCLAIPITVGIIGVSDLAAFGTNLGIVAIVASAAMIAWTLWTHSHGKGSGESDG
jgi:hypothetical protein